MIRAFRAQLQASSASKVRLREPRVGPSDRLIAINALGGGGNQSICIYFLFLCIYIYVCVYEHFHAVGTLGGQKRVSHSLELAKIQAVASHLMWILGRELRSSGRATRTPHCLAIFPAPGPFRVRLAPPQALLSFITTTFKVPRHCWQLWGGRGNISQL